MSAIWPLFDLTVSTPLVQLRYVDDELGEALMSVAADGIHDDAFMPFSSPWTRISPPELQRQGLQFHWQLRADHKQERWRLPFAVLVDGVPAGIQAIHADNFAVTRWVSTGSWLGQAFQRRGIGKEMRAAALHLAFEGLGAEYAATSAFADNAASLGVTRALGYEPNGFSIEDREGVPVRQDRFVLTRAVWTAQRRDDISIEGLAACAEELGA